MATSVILSPQPVLQFFGSDGTELAGGLLTTTVGGIPYPTYSESTGTFQLPNPIVLNNRGEIATSTGQSSPLFIIPNVVYNYNLTDAAGNLIWNQPSLMGAQTILTQATVGAALWSLSNAEQLASVTPTNFGYPWGDVRRYGADVTGGTDSTAAFNNALRSNTLVYAIAGSYTMSGTLNMVSGQTLYGDGNVTVLNWANGAIDNILASSVVGAVVRDLKINVTGITGTSRLGGVHILNSAYCVVERVEMTGLNYSGVLIDFSSNNRIVGNRFHDFYYNNLIDQTDIEVYGSGSNYNVIDGNECFGSCVHGVLIQDPYSALTASNFPSRNIVTNNRIGLHHAYGIAVYMPGSLSTPPPASDSSNQIIGNYVENIQGDLPSNTASGAGIYVVGLGAGATQVIGNNVRNCCVLTATRSLAPAGVGISGISGPTPVLVEGNTVNMATQGDGILVTSSPGGVSIGPNTVSIASTNNGTGTGGSSLAGACVRIEASSNVSCTGGVYSQAGSSSAFFAFANGINCTNLSVDGGIYTSTGVGPTFRTFQNGGFTLNNFSASSVQASTTNAAANALQLANIVGAQIANCTGAATTLAGLNINTCTQVRVIGGAYSSTGSNSISTSGTCTGSLIDRSVYWEASSGTGALMNNAATGLRVLFDTAAVPSAGTWAVGDTGFTTTPTAAGVYLWTTTTAGAGTWKTISNT